MTTPTDTALEAAPVPPGPAPAGVAVVQHIATAPMHAAQPIALLKSWDPFQLMDRLDEEILHRELQGIESKELVYSIKQGGQVVEGLTKVGIDEGCRILATEHAQAIREEDVEYAILGEGDDREALFKVRAARYAVAPTGQEVKLDQVIGVKRQPLFYEPVALDIDAKVPSRKYKGRTYRELLATADGRDYLAWMSENFGEPEIREFTKRLLAGEAVEGVQRGRQLNPHWFEHGAMKAARNARFRLLPAETRAHIKAIAQRAGGGRIREIVQDDVEAVARGQASRDQMSYTGGDDATERLRAEEAARREAPKPASAASSAGAARGAASSPSTTAPSSTPQPQRSPATTNGVASGPPATEKQIAFYRRLAEHNVFTEKEKIAALAWLEGPKCNRQSIKDMIDWLKRQIEVRPGNAGKTNGAATTAAATTAAPAGATRTTTDSKTRATPATGDVPVSAQPSKAQHELIDKLSRSHIWSDDEKTDLVAERDACATREEAEALIDRMLSTIKERKAAEVADEKRREAAVATQDKNPGAPTPAQSEDAKRLRYEISNARAGIADMLDHSSEKIKNYWGTMFDNMKDPTLEDLQHLHQQIYRARAEEEDAAKATTKTPAKTAAKPPTRGGKGKR